MSVDPTIQAAADKINADLAAAVASLQAQVSADVAALVALIPAPAPAPALTDPQVVVAGGVVTVTVDCSASVTLVTLTGAIGTPTNSTPVNGVATLTLSALPPGTYTLTLQGEDAAGDQSTPVTVTATVPTPTPPPASTYWQGVIPPVGQPFDQKVWPHQSMVSNHVQSALDPQGSGDTVMRFAIPDGDFPYAETYASRADFESPHMLGPTQNPAAGEYNDIYCRLDWLADPQLLSAPLVAGTAASFYDLAELYGAPYGGSPTVGFALRGYNGANYVSFHRAAPESYDTPWVAPVPLDASWHSYVLHVHWAADPTGFVELWYDGVQQQFSTAHASGFQDGVTRIYYPTLAAGINWNGQDSQSGWNFLNVCSYRTVRVWPGTITTYYRNIAIGPTLGSVMA